MIGYSTLDFTGYVDTINSTYGYIFLLTKEVTSWKTTKQTMVAMSTMESKFIGCYEATT